MMSSTNLWEVIEIVAEEGKRFQVRWAGKDPKTGKPWPLDWIPSSHCSSELVKDWERKKGARPVTMLLGHIHVQNDTAKKQESLPSASTSASPFSSVTRKRPSEKRDTRSASQTRDRLTRKRKHPTPSGSPGNTDEDSAPSRRKRPATAVDVPTGGVHGGQAAARALSLSSRGDRLSAEASPPHPPLEEIEMWVPTPNAKFGPPKRKHAVDDRRVLPKKGPTGMVVSARASAESSGPVPPSPPVLSESQIIALRQEEEESQSQAPDSQAISNPTAVTAKSTLLGDPMQPSAEDLRGLTNARNTLGGRPSVDILPDPSTNKSIVLESSSHDVASRPNAFNTSTQGGDVRNTPKGSSSLPTAPHISLSNRDASTSATSTSELPQPGKPARSALPPIEQPSASPIEQPSPSGSAPSRFGNGTLAERRAFEARARLDELRRAGANFGSLSKGNFSALKTSQSSERPPHVVLKQVTDHLESFSQSQVTAPVNSGNELPEGAPLIEHSIADPADELDVDLMISSQDANVGSLPLQDDAVAAEVVVLDSEDEVPPTASDSSHSQRHDTPPQASLGDQQAALDLLHKKSEEISELQALVDTLRGQKPGGEEKLAHGNGALHGGEGAHYLAAEVQTDRDDEALAAFDSERTRWTEEKATLEGEVEALRSDKARALADVDFFREQYQRASDFASSTRSENEELLARATLAESQAASGVALVRATFEARVAKLEAEVQKYRALSEMLTERARRTDDDVRYRAALAPEFEREFKQLRRQFKETEAELEETMDDLRAEKRSNARLRRRIARLKATEQAYAGDSPAQDSKSWNDEDDDADGDYRDEDGPGPADAEIEQLLSVGLDEGSQPRGDDTVYLCHWRPGEPEGDCDAAVASNEELLEHVTSHHLSCH
ncbi:hypothetical protein BC826DRAFT_1020915 [Russula brevipes]|nr:hypothetical protein BC826DRAFT_1020915 [Russula brevipes]